MEMLVQLPIKLAYGTNTDIFRIRMNAKNQSPPNILIRHGQLNHPGMRQRLLIGKSDSKNYKKGFIFFPINLQTPVEVHVKEKPAFKSLNPFQDYVNILPYLMLITI